MCVHSIVTVVVFPKEKTVVVDSMNLKIYKGEILALLGHNGDLFFFH